MKPGIDDDQLREIFEIWLANTDSPHKFVAWFNYGVMLFASGQRAAAQNAYQQAINLRPDFLQARLNLGTVREAEGDTTDALAIWESVAADSDAAPDMLVLALNNLGRLREILREYAAAEDALRKSLLVRPDQHDVIHHYVHLRQKQCKWPVLSSLPGVSQSAMVRAMSPLAMLAHIDSSALQLLAAENFVKRKLKVTEGHLCAGKNYQHKRTRIGYLSGDLCAHAVGFLMPEVLEHHDRERFEIFVYDYSREVGPETRERIRAASQHFRPVGQLTDEQVAKMIAADEIDILIEMHGLSAGTRPGIIALRPAPLQATWLGYIGTTALPWIDYVIADSFALPEHLLPLFSEKPLYIEPTFIPGDSRRKIGKTITRGEVGLPEEQFIFASFNNVYKLNPVMFSCWMDILRSVEDSVLWMVDDNPWATENLKREAAARNIDPKRLIFSARVAPEDYLARIPLADLFLDNHPYNAGSTANDVLWMGLPMLTLAGESFVSRMAGSLINSAGCDELIVNDHQTYVRRAIELAENPDGLTRIRDKLALRRASWDPTSFVRTFEARLADMLGGKLHDSAQTGALPAPRLNPDVMPMPELYQIAYSEATMASVRAPFSPLDNRKNERPDWQEYWPIRRFLLSNSLDEERLYGFFSPRLTEKTGLTPSQIQQFVLEHGPRADVLTFSPQPDMGAFFLNVFEQNELFDQGFMQTSQAFFDSVGLNVNIASLIMDSRTTVFSNYIVARPRFWRAWLSLNERLFSLCEGTQTNEIRSALLQPTNYRGVQRKVFLMERVASLILALDSSYRVKAYNTFLCAWSATNLGRFKSEAVLSDALKTAMLATGNDTYLAEYARIRSSIHPHPNA
jgi:predicted O-linked N-acetylglucosamine transferase (SPINDLY family)